jgi:sugar phosphate isomerase/epimerase
MMENLGIEFISVFGLPPVEFVQLAHELGCRHITAALEPIEYNPHGYPKYSLRDRATRRDLAGALKEFGLSLSGEGFLVQPGAEAGVANAEGLEIMAELGVRSINAVSLEPDFARNVDQFGQLAETAAGFGIETMIEFVPIFTVPDLPTAEKIVRKIGRPDVKLMVDTMHVARSGATAADLAALDPALVGYIQLCDAPLKPVIPDYMDEAMHQRLVPGEGELPLLDMLAALPRDRIVGLEVPLRSEAEAGVGTKERMSRCVAAAADLFARLN